MHHARAEVDRLEHRLCACGALRRRGSVINQRQLNVVQRCRAREKIEGLKDEPDLFVADAGKFIVIEL